MQANIPVIVTDESHPRAKTAGRTISAAPFVPPRPAAARVDELRQQLAAARQAEAEAGAAFTKAERALHSAAAAADQVATDLAAAVEAAGPDAEPLPPHVTVLFDLDGQAVDVPVASLAELR